MAVECPFCHKLQHLHELPAEDIVWQFPHSVVLLGPWQYFSGYCIVVHRRHVSGLSELTPDQRHAYFDEMCLAAQAIENAFQPRKLNYELLGNQVPHLHWHLFPRRADDPDVLKPVWLALERAETDDSERSRLLTGVWPRAEIAAKLRKELDGLEMAVSPDEIDDLQPEYDFRTIRGVVRGKYAARYRERLRLIRLADDVAGAFADEAAVNEALREYLRNRPSPGNPPQQVPAG